MTVKTEVKLEDGSSKEVIIPRFYASKHTKNEGMGNYAGIMANTVAIQTDQAIDNQAQIIGHDKLSI